MTTFGFFGVSLDALEFLKSQEAVKKISEIRVRIEQSLCFIIIDLWMVSKFFNCLFKNVKRHLLNAQF